MTTERVPMSRSPVSRGHLTREHFLLLERGEGGAVSDVFKRSVDDGTLIIFEASAARSCAFSARIESKCPDPITTMFWALVIFGFSLSLPTTILSW